MFVSSVLERFDHLPCSLIKARLETIKVSPIIRNFFIPCMKLKKTTLILIKDAATINSGQVNINYEIFEWDSLFPLLFCLALFPLSKLLNTRNYGHKVHEKNINYLTYMDDLNIFVK